MRLFLWRVKNKIRRLFGFPAVPKSCCRKAENLEVIFQGPLTVRRCVVCQCRHFEVVVEPGHFGIRGS